jgi:aminoglycoside phosphotransferase (APT) family kinase protein
VQKRAELIDLNATNVWLSQNTTNVFEATSCKKFLGGYSNLTYLLESKSGERLVLRRPPTGAADIRRGHDVLREYRILCALDDAGFDQIPQPIAVCEDTSVIGAPFFVMQWVEGDVIRVDDAARWQPQLTPRDWKVISEAFCDQLVKLHALNIEATGLFTLGKPSGYIRRQVEGWSQRYEVAQTDDVPQVVQVAEWLARHLPEEVAPTLLHNDFKYDNAILDPNQLTHIRAMLDWEMATVGDPRMDLGTALSYWSEAADGPFERSFNLTWLPGNLTRREFVERYTDRSGQDYRRDMVYFYVFGLFKNAVVMQQIYRRYQAGLTDDARFGRLIEGVRTLSNKALRSIERDDFL